MPLRRCRASETRSPALQRIKLQIDARKPYSYSFDKDTMPLYLRLGVSLLTTHMLLLPVGIFIDLIDLFGVVLLLIADVLGKGIPEKKQDGEDVIEIRISVWLVVGIVVLLAGSMIYLILRAEF